MNDSRRLQRTVPLLWALLVALGYIVLCPRQLMGVLVSEARANNISYAYDALGRVAQATDSTAGQAVIYHYDAAGNITSQQAVALTTLAFAATSSDQGAPGTQIVINGTGFSTTASANIVTFNGIAATVISATQTQLVVTVPAGATSGPISVHTGSSTVTGGAFTVAAGDVAPSITSFSPALAAAGTSIAVTGAGFDTTPANDLVQFGFGGWASASSATATTLNVTVPATGWSGKIHVLTAHGGGSAGDFFTPPSGYTVSQIGSTGRTQPNTQTTVSLPTAHLSSLQIFDGNAGDLLTFSVSSVSIAFCTVKIFAPTGALLTTFSVSSSTQPIQLPALPDTGTYAIVLDPGANTGSLTFNVASPLQISISLGAPPTTVTLAYPGQTARISFSATPGSFVTLNLTNVTFLSSHVTLLDPSGSVVLASTQTTSALSFEPQLQMEGTYTLLVTPGPGTPGSFQIAATSTPAATLNLGQNTTVSLSLGATLTSSFAAKQGQYLTVGFGGTTPQQTNSGSATVSYSLLAPDASIACSGSFSVTWQGSNTTTNGGSCDLAPAAETGTYQIQFTTSSAVNLFLALSAPATASLDPSQPPVSVALSLPGQGAFLTFSGTAGQYMAFSVQHTNTLSPIFISYQNTQFTVTRPDGIVLQTTALGLDAFGTTVIVSNLGQLPVSGTYKIFFDPQAAATGTMVFTVSLPLAGGNIPFDNSTAANPLARQGQALAKTFSGALGEPAFFTMSARDSGISSAQLNIVSPSGKSVAPVLGPNFSYGCSAYGCQPPQGQSNPCQPGVTPCDVSATVFVPPLTEVGTYTVLLSQTTSSNYSQAGLGTWNFSAASVMTGTLTVNGPIVTPGNSSLFQMTFAGNAGQSYSVTVTPPSSGMFAQAWIVSPNGTYIANGTPVNGFCTVTCPWSTFTMSTPTLSQSGTYSVVLESLPISNFSFKATSP